MLANPKTETAAIYLETAVEIGNRLVEEAIWNDRRCTWTGDNMELVDNEWKVVHETIDESIYSGTCGIALFLARLWRASGNEQFMVTARGALRQSLERIDAVNQDISPGFFNGLAGIAWATVEIGHLLGDLSLVDEGFHLADRVCHDQGNDRPNSQLDLIDGLAGALIGLIYLYKIKKEASLEKKFRRIANQVVQSARQTTAGWSWGQQTDSDEPVHLCGMGHGASGIAYALMECYVETGDEKLRQAAHEAIRYEKSWFNRFRSNWPDIRDAMGDSPTKENSLTYPVYWCHGAGGIGLARLRFYQLTKDPSMLAEAGAAIQAANAFMRNLTRNHRGLSPEDEVYDRNFSVCHGLGSIIELFTYAYQVIGIKDYLELARKIGNLGIKNSSRHQGRWQCGIPGGEQNPSLMLGLAGIGSAYLRLFNPDLMPPVGILTDKSVYSASSH